MSKFTSHDKLTAVSRYLNGNESYKTIVESIGAAKLLVITWVKLFGAQEIDVFKKGYTNYSNQLKLHVVKNHHYALLMIKD